MKLAIIGDYDPLFRPHIATNEAISHVSNRLQIQVEFDWIATSQIAERFEMITKTYNAFWIAPGSPYKSMEGALSLIEYARQNNIPTLGTCGGFQHMVIEFARNVLNVKDAEHAEYDPYASKLVINPLSCTLAGQKLKINLTDSASLTYKIYEASTIEERYYCNFGLNPEYQPELDGNGFKVVGTDTSNEARILELKNHPFFIATLFVPQDNSNAAYPHKLIMAFIESARS